MKKRVKGRKLSRTPAHRKALFRNLIQALFKHGRIQTTLPKAKEIRPLAEKLITKAKPGTPHAYQEIEGFFYQKELAKKLFDKIAPSYKNRSGGYTRIIKLDRRGGDAAEMAVIELVKEESAQEKPKAK